MLAITCSGITLTNNKSKYIMKFFHMLWKTLENRGVLFKGTATKITCEEGGFLNLLRSLMAGGSSLIKSLLTCLMKNQDF